MRRDYLSTSPLSETQVTIVRVRLFAFWALLLFCALLSRLWYLQVYRGETYREQADVNRMRQEREAAPRGLIVDVNGRILVNNSAQFTVYLLPTDLPKSVSEKQAVLVQLCTILGMTPQALDDQIRRSDPGASNPIPIAAGVKDSVVAQIAENQRRLPGVHTSVEPVRAYPYGTLAAHVVGYSGLIGPKQLQEPAIRARGFKPGDFIGTTGVERQYDALLVGKSGGRWYEVDARGRRRREVTDEESPTIAGDTLRLGIDLDVQKACESALAGRNGAAVALDTRDGHIIAMASFPTYDPGIFTHRPLPVATYAALRQKTAFFNRAIQACFQPGSTFKIITSAAGLGTGVTTESTDVFCAGGMRVGNRFKKCDGFHGDVDLTTAIEVSCDTFFYRQGLAIGPERLIAWARNFGLGQKSGLDLPGESAGWKQKRVVSHYPGDTANMAIGQGDDLATPLQMALVASAIANGGTIYTPHIVMDATSSSDRSIQYRMAPEVAHRIPLTPEQIAVIARGMRQVVIGERGTSHAGNLAGIDIAGKSGSAETRTGGPTHAWFTCFAPYENPRIAVCVFLEANGHHLHGGVDAAPIARHMIAAYFHVPDKLASAGGGHIAD